MHTVRIMMVGIRLIETGEFRVDWTDKRDYLLGIKHGSVPKDEALAHAEEMRQRILKEIDDWQAARDEYRNSIYDYVNNTVIDISKKYLDL